MAASAASGVAAEIQRLLSVARKSTDGAERATTLRSATFELLEHGTGLLREVVPQIMEFMVSQACFGAERLLWGASPKPC